MSSGSKTKDATFKARIRHNHGCDEDFYSNILAYKRAWESSMFFVDEQHVQNVISKGSLQAKPLPSVSNLNIPDIVEEQLNDISGIVQNQLSFTLDKNGESRPQILPFGESIGLQDQLARTGLILNAGGTITSMKWLPVPLDQTDATHHYLALSTIFNADGLENTINSPELSVFKQPNGSGKNSIQSTIQIWKYDLDSNTIELEKIYDTTLLGASENLTWVPVYVTDPKVLGVLAGTFTDGKLHLFKIEHYVTSRTSHRSRFTTITKPSITYDPASCFLGKESPPNFTSFDFLGSERIIVGTNDGNVAEFVLPFGEDEDIHVPSYVMRATESSVTLVFVVEMASNKHLVYINSSGTDIVAYEYSNFLQDKVIPTAKPVFRPTFNPRLNMVLYPHSADLMAFSFYRSIHESGNFLLKLEGFLSAIASSEILGHPLSLTGTSSGDVIVLNHTRKYLHGSKTTNKVLTPLTLWKLTYENKILKVNADYEVIPVEQMQQHPISPHQVLISHLAWNDNVTGSSVYSVGTASGLVILERLDPRYSK